MSGVALIHGFLGSPMDWDPIRASLACRSTAVDVPVADNWHDGISRIQRQLPQNSILVGYSMGGRLALGCALENQRAIRGLVVISANPGLPEDDRAGRWESDQRVCDSLARMPLETFLKTWYRQDVFRSLSERQIEEFATAKRTLDPARFVRLMSCYSIARQPNYWPRLKQLELPVAVIVGQQDAKYRELGQAMERHISDCQLHVVPNAGHIVHREQPKQFCDLLNAFVSSLPKETNGDE